MCSFWRDAAQPASSIQPGCGAACVGAPAPIQIHTSGPCCTTGKARVRAPGGTTACEGTPLHTPSQPKRAPW